MKTYIILTMLSSLLYSHAVHGMMVVEKKLVQETIILVNNMLDQPKRSYNLMHEFIKNNPDQTTIKNEKTGNTNLHDYVTVFCDNKDPIRFLGAAALFANGADPNITNNAKESALDIATQLNNAPLIALFKIKNLTKQDLIKLASNHNVNGLLWWLE